MKKVFVLVLTLMLSFVLFYKTPGLNADSTNYWDSTKITNSNIVDNTVTILEYNDPSLIDGLYELRVLYTGSLDFSFFDLLTNVNTPGVSLLTLSNTGKLVISPGQDYITLTFEMSDGYFKFYNNFDGGFTPLVHNSFSSDSWSLYLLDITEISPTFSESELTLQIPYDDLMTVQEIQALLSASDLQDGDLTSSIQLVEETYTDWQLGDPLGFSSVQSFTILPSSSSFTSPFEISSSIWNDLSIYRDDVLIVDCGEPLGFVASTLYFNSAILFELSLEEETILQLNVDGSLIHDSSTYRLELNVPMYLKFSVEDSSGNIAYMTVNVEIINEDFPIITHPDYDVDIIYSSEYQQSYSIDIFLPNTLTDSEFLSELTLIANDFNISFYGHALFDGSQFITDFSIYDFSSFISAFDFSLTSTIYTIEDIETDDGRMIFIEFNVSFVDNTIPKITSPYKIIRSDSASLTFEQIKAQLVYSDEGDDNSELVITQVSTTYNPSSSQTGRYLVTYRITDPAGNYSEHTVAIWVVDFTPPVWTVPENVFVNVSINNPLSEEDLPNLLQSMGLIVTVDDYSVSVLSGDYFDNSSTPGSYSQLLRLTYNDDSFQDLNVQFNVIEEDMTLTPEEPSVSEPILVIKQILSISASALLIIIPISLFVIKKRKH